MSRSTSEVSSGVSADVKALIDAGRTIERGQNQQVVMTNLGDAHHRTTQRLYRNDSGMVVFDPVDRTMRFEAATPNGMADLVNAWSLPKPAQSGAEPGQTKQTRRVVVYVGPSRAVALLDGENPGDECDIGNGWRQPYAVLDMPEHPAFRLASSRHDWTQLDLIETLRTYWRDLVEPIDLLPSLRTIKFRTGTSGTSISEHSASNFSVGHEAELSGLSALPEDIGVRVPVFAFSDETHHVRLAFIPRPSKQMFVTVPNPTEVEAVRALAVQEVADSIRRGIRDDLQAEVVCGVDVGSWFEPLPDRAAENA